MLALEENDPLCKFCKDTGVFENHKGDFVCEHCALDLCESCYAGDQEVETRSGRYICSDCYSGEIDTAYERMRDDD